MAVSKSLVKNYSWYVGKVSELMWDLQGTDDFEAYEELFPIERPDARAHYEILNDGTNRRIMVAVYRNKGLSLDDLTTQLSLSAGEVRKRIGFFVANGMDRNYVPK